MSFKEDVVKRMIINRITNKDTADYGDKVNTALDAYIQKNFSDSDSLSKSIEESESLSDVSPEEKLKKLEDAGIELGPNWKEQLVTKGLPVLGDVARGFGTALSARDMMLAKALNNMAAISASNSQKKFYGPTAADLAAAYASPGLEGKAIVSKAVGDLVGNRLEKIANDLGNDWDKERMLRYQAAADPSSEFWRYYAKATPSSK